MLSWPNSPLLVTLHFIDLNELFGEEGGTNVTPLHTPLQHLAELAAASEYLTHVNQLVLVKQLIEHGTNVNVLSSPHGMIATPLHLACLLAFVTNLDFIELLLAEKGADPNAQDHFGENTVDVHHPVCSRCSQISTELAYHGRQYYRAIWRVLPLGRVRLTITTLSDKVALPDNPCQIQDQFQIQQWRDIEEMLVERGAAGTGITTPEYSGLGRASNMVYSSIALTSATENSK
jgi:hypothetical protein